MAIACSRILISCALVLASLVPPTAATASSASVDGVDGKAPSGTEAGRISAQAALAQGNQRLKDGDAAGAIAAYRHAQESYPPAAGKLEFNIAKAEEARGDEPAAAAALELFLAQPPEVSPEFREEARSNLARMAASLGVLRLPGHRPGLVVVVDGQGRGTTPLRGSVWVRPGPRAVKVTEGDAVLSLKKVDVRAGEVVDLDLAEGPIALGGTGKGTNAAPVAPAPLVALARPLSLQASSAPRNTPGNRQEVPLTQQRSVSSDGERSPLWKKWWVWAAGAALIAGTIAVIVVANRCEANTECMPAALSPPQPTPTN